MPFILLRQSQAAGNALGSAYVIQAALRQIAAWLAWSQAPQGKRKRKQSSPRGSPGHPVDPNTAQSRPKDCRRCQLACFCSSLCQKQQQHQQTLSNTRRQSEIVVDCDRQVYVNIPARPNQLDGFPIPSHQAKCTRLVTLVSQASVRNKPHSLLEGAYTWIDLSESRLANCCKYRQLALASE